MEEHWWEKPVCIICDYWWAFLASIILGLVLLFTPWVNRQLALMHLESNAIPLTFLDEIGFSPENVGQARAVVQKYHNQQSFVEENAELYQVFEEYQTAIEVQEQKVLDDLQAQAIEDFDLVLAEIEEAQKTEYEGSLAFQLVCTGASFMPGVGTIIDGLEVVALVGFDRNLCSPEEPSEADYAMAFASLGLDFADWAQNAKNVSKLWDAWNRLGDLAKIDINNLDEAKAIAKLLGFDPEVIDLLVDLRKASDEGSLFAKIDDLKQAGKWDSLLDFATDLNNADTDAILQIIELRRVPGQDARHLDDMLGTLKSSGRYRDVASRAESILRLRTVDNFSSAQEVLPLAQATKVGNFGRVLKLSGLATDLNDVVNKLKSIDFLRDVIRKNKWDENLEIIADFRPGARATAWEHWAYDNVPDMKLYKPVLRGVNNYIFHCSDTETPEGTIKTICWDIVENYQQPEEEQLQLAKDKYWTYRYLKFIGNDVYLVFSQEPPASVKAALPDNVAIITPESLP